EVDLEIRGRKIRTTGPPRSTVALVGRQTIDGLFNLIEEAIDQRAAAINVTYHPTLGYPLDAYIDYDLRIADEELGFTIHQLTLR
ncbi:MAG: hypothetical protein HOH95_05130, partial [Dehalococcoidia bacterium]|nr:hypothetical protein [Dehalococcoidia bacterium]